MHSGTSLSLAGHTRHFRADFVYTFKLTAPLTRNVVQMRQVLEILPC